MISDGGVCVLFDFKWEEGYGFVGLDFLWRVEWFLFMRECFWRGDKIRIDCGFLISLIGFFKMFDRINVIYIKMSR